MPKMVVLVMAGAFLAAGLESSHELKAEEVFADGHAIVPTTMVVCPNVRLSSSAPQEHHQSLALTAIGDHWERQLWRRGGCYGQSDW
jgi:hypothetical protein